MLTLSSQHFYIKLEARAWEYLLKDESTRYWSIDPTSLSTTHALPDNVRLKQSIDGFVKSLSVSEDEARKIEQKN